MNPFLSHIHAELRRARLTKRGATHRAEDVPRGTHKAYERMPKIELPAPRALDMRIDEAIKRRRSAHSGAADVPISFEEIGTLFGAALGKHEDGIRRHYPSGGALFPIETYVISSNLGGEAPAAYHFNPSLHALERLWGLPESFNIKTLAKSPDALPLSALIVFTSVWSRSSAKYGDLSYQHALIEAGHMSENILLVATAMGLPARPYAGFHDELITELLDLDPEREQAVHSVTLCSQSMQ